MKHFLLMVSVFVLMTACSKVNNENYDAIETGMDYSEIEALLGNPTECDEIFGMKQCKWGDYNKNIDVKFIADKVSIFSKKGL